MTSDVIYIMFSVFKALLSFKKSSSPKGAVRDPPSSGTAFFIPKQVIYP